MGNRSLLYNFFFKKTKQTKIPSHVTHLPSCIWSFRMMKKIEAKSSPLIQLVVTKSQRLLIAFLHSSLSVFNKFYEPTILLGSGDNSNEHKRHRSHSRVFTMSNESQTFESDSK